MLLAIYPDLDLDYSTLKDQIQIRPIRASVAIGITKFKIIIGAVNVALCIFFNQWFAIFSAVKISK
jgi:hypothetical protein